MHLFTDLMTSAGSTCWCIQWGYPIHPLTLSWPLDPSWLLRTGLIKVFIINFPHHIFLYFHSLKFPFPMTSCLLYVYLLGIEGVTSEINRIWEKRIKSFMEIKTLVVPQHWKPTVKHFICKNYILIAMVMSGEVWEGYCNPMVRKWDGMPILIPDFYLFYTVKDKSKDSSFKTFKITEWHHCYPLLPHAPPPTASVPILSLPNHLSVNQRGDLRDPIHIQEI